MPIIKTAGLTQWSLGAGAQARGTVGVPAGAYTSNPTYVTESSPPAVAKV